MTKNILVKPISTPKPVKIVITAVVGTAAVLLIAWLVLLFIATRISFNYVNGTAGVLSGENRNAEEYKAFLSENNYEMNFPFFGNSTLLYGGAAHIYSIPIYLDDMTAMSLVDTYDAVNDPIDAWIRMLTYTYDSRGRIDYTVEESGGKLTVHFTGAMYTESGETAENIDKEFVYEIKGASIKNPPEWINRTANDDYYMNLEYAK